MADKRKPYSDLPIERIRQGLDGAANDNVYYRYLLDACDIVERQQEEIAALKKANDDYREVNGVALQTVVEMDKRMSALAALFRSN